MRSLGNLEDNRMDREGHSTRNAVLLFVDEQQASAGSPGSLLGVLIRHWQLIAATTLITLTATLAYAFLAPRWYRAQAVIAPVSQGAGASTLSSLNNQLGGLATLVGLNPDDEVLKRESIARLMSREFIYDFLREERLLPILFSERWDADKGRWKGTLGTEEPTLEVAYKYFIGNVCTISEDRRNGLVKITVDWKDPELASSWANKLIARINEDQRAIARAEVGRNLEYLNRELTQTTIVELRQSINRLIEAEIRKLMLANVREQYAFKVIDPAFTPGLEGVVRPRRAVFAIAALFFGVSLGCLLSLTVDRLKAAKH